MADNKTQAPVKAPQAATPAKTPETAKEAKKEPKPKLVSVFATSDEATKAAGERTKGPRRAFQCKLGDKEYFVVANNEGRAGGIAFEQLGGSVQEIGKAPKTKAVTVDALLAMIANMPEAERTKIEEQLKAGKK